MKQIALRRAAIAIIALLPGSALLILLANFWGNLPLLLAYSIPALLFVVWLVVAIGTTERLAPDVYPSPGAFIKSGRAQKNFWMYWGGWAGVAAPALLIAVLFWDYYYQHRGLQCGFSATSSLLQICRQETYALLLYLVNMFFALALFLLFMFGFWAFVVWDRKRLQDPQVTPLSRDAMNKGFKPTGVVAWQAWLAVSALFAVLAVAEWYSPTRPPFSGRWSWINAAFFQSFGVRGMFTAYCAATCLFASCSFFLAWRRRP